MMQIEFVCWCVIAVVCVAVVVFIFALCDSGIESSDDNSQRRKSL